MTSGRRRSGRCAAHASPIARAARSSSAARSSRRHGDIDAAVRRLVSGRLEQLARRIRPTRTWDDLMLPRRPDGAAARDRRPATATPTRCTTSGGSRRRRRAGWSRCSPDRRAPARRWPPRSSPASSASTCSSSTCRRSSASTSARPRRTSSRSSTPPAPATSCCSSTRPTRCSASAPRSRTPTTATPTSRCRTCSSGSRAYDGLVVLATNFETQHRRGVPPPDPRPRRVPDARRRRAACDLAAQPPGRRRRSTTSTSTLLAAPVRALRRRDPQRRRARRVPGRRGRPPITMERAVRGVGREFRKAGRMLKPEDFGPYYELVASTVPQSGTAPLALTSPHDRASLRARAQVMVFEQHSASGRSRTPVDSKTERVFERGPVARSAGHWCTNGHVSSSHHVRVHQ